MKKPEKIPQKFGKVLDTIFAPLGAFPVRVDKKHRVLAWVGRLGAEKNWRAVLEVFNRLKNQHLVLWLAGGDEPPEALQELHRCVDSLNIGNRLRSLAYRAIGEIVFTLRHCPA